MSFNMPLHPATVHWPIALLSVSYGLDVLPVFQPYLPGLITSRLPPAVELTRISYYALSLGLLFGIPAVLSGVAQAVQIVGKQGLYEADGKSLKPKMKTLTVHALANDVIMGVSAYSWWGRSVGDAVNTGELGKAAVGIVLGLGLMWSAHLGGKLTYENGMGMSFGKKGKSA